MTFKDAVRLVLNIEGGEVNDAYDPGGETKYGISKKSYPDLDIENISIEDAEEIYKRDFWDKVHADNLPDSLKLVAFDSAVNCGVHQAIKFLQSSVNVPADGLIGPASLQAISNCTPSDTLVAVLLARYKYYTQLDTFPHFGNGWVKRLFTIAVHSG